MSRNQITIFFSDNSDKKNTTQLKVALPVHGVLRLKARFSLGSQAGGNGGRLPVAKATNEKCVRLSTKHHTGRDKQGRKRKKPYVQW